LSASLNPDAAQLTWTTTQGYACLALFSYPAATLRREAHTAVKGFGGCLPRLLHWWWEHVDKKTIAKDIPEGRRQKYGRAGVLNYCQEDVKESTQLLCAQLRDRCEYRVYVLPAEANTDGVLHWSHYSAKTISQIQAHGMPIDGPAVQLGAGKHDSRHRQMAAPVWSELWRWWAEFTARGEWSYSPFE
jgi:hypothetical protein